MVDIKTSVLSVSGKPAMVIMDYVIDTSDHSLKYDQEDTYNKLVNKFP